MKECNIPFCKMIPNTWTTIPNKYLFKYHSTKVGKNANKFQLLSLTTKGVKEKDINSSGGKQPDNYEKYQTVEPGDMIFCLFDLDVSAVFSGLSSYEGMITSAYDVVRPNSLLLNELYSKFWFQYVFSNRYYKIYSKNIRYTITSDMFKSIQTPIPPISVQKKMGLFLESKCSKIDELIALENQQIEKLKEYKQALITEIVTKGLDKTVEMKDSGNSFLGKIPKHWDINKVKFIANRLAKGNGITKEDVVIDGDTPCVRYGEIYTKYNIHFNKCCTKTNKSLISKHEYFNYGDILFSGTGELVEEIGKNIVYLGNENCLAGGDIIILGHSQNPLFLSYLLNSDACQMQKSYGKAKLKVVHISATEIGNITICLPSRTEQDLIVEFLNNKCSKIDTLISNKQQKIEKLNEYKKSLIYEYVTGKKEVI